MTVATIRNLPASELGFHWKSGRLCLDFVATVGERWRRSFERLLEPEDLARWMLEAGMLETAPPVSQGQLHAARGLREVINRLARPGLEPRLDDHERLNRWSARPALAPQLADNGELVWVGARPVEAMLSTIARDAVDLLSGPVAGRVRECSAPDCALLYVDLSRPGRRRWCSGEACGNRTRTKSYRQRRKQQL